MGTVIGHNLKFDASYLSRMQLHLGVSDAVMALDAWNHAFSNLGSSMKKAGHSLKEMVAKAMTSHFEVGDLVLVDPDQFMTHSRIGKPRLANIVKHAVSPFRVLVVFKDTGEEGWVDSYALTSIDVVEALAWLAE